MVWLRSCTQRRVDWKRKPEFGFLLCKATVWVGMKRTVNTLLWVLNDFSENLEISRCLDLSFFKRISPRNVLCDVTCAPADLHRAGSWLRRPSGSSPPVEIPLR